MHRVLSWRPREDKGARDCRSRPFPLPLYRKA